MKVYEWKDMDTGEIVEHTNPSLPPREGNWRRIFTVGIGAVGGAGSSPSRTSVRRT